MTTPPDDEVRWETVVASQARKAFDANCTDIDLLLELTADTPGRRRSMEVLNKAGIVLITSFWEAYCEDLAAEALEHLVSKAPNAAKLPLDLQKIVAKALKAEPHELAVWKLADDGWRDLLRGRLADLQQERNRKLNTPKTDQINDLFMKAIGMAKISSDWSWDGMTPDQAALKLDGYVTLRGEVAHRGRAANLVTKDQVADYYAHVIHLVGKTGGAANRAARRSTGVPLWSGTRRRPEK